MAQPCNHVLLLFGLLFTGVLSACAADAPVPTVTATAGQPTAIDSGEAPLTPPSTPTGDAFTTEREQLVQQGIINLGIEDEEIVAAMRAVPRHEFVPESYRDLAYRNHPLPIGYGQTISQPYIVALMTQAAGVSAGDRVLEIGTGSGYQAAVLAELVDHVYSMEIIGPLADSARTTLELTGYENVTVRHGDGYFGWEEMAPFDAVVVTAAPDHIPQPLVEQLKIGGNMVIPVGPVGGFQTLWLVTKVSEDQVRTVDLGGVSFVPFTREE